MAQAKTGNERYSENADRQVLPTDFEFKKRDDFNRDKIKVNPQADECVRTRAFQDFELKGLDRIADKEKEDFVQFCKDNSKYEDFFFYAQVLKGTQFSPMQIKALEKIQDIPESDKRLIYQRAGNCSLDEFKTKIQDFKKNNKDKNCIPLLDLDAESVSEVALLKSKAQFLIDEGFEKAMVIFRGRKKHSNAWKTALPTLSEKMKVYVAEVPVKRDNGFSAIIYCFIMNASKVFHYRHKQGGGEVTPVFLEETWELKTERNASEGIADYKGQNRKEVLKQDGRISMVYPFSRWDRVVQANEWCKKVLNVADLTKVVSLKKAFSHFMKP